MTFIEVVLRATIDTLNQALKCVLYLYLFYIFCRVGTWAVLKSYGQWLKYKQDKETEYGSKEKKEG